MMEDNVLVENNVLVEDDGGWTSCWWRTMSWWRMTPQWRTTFWRWQHPEATSRPGGKAEGPVALLGPVGPAAPP